MQKLLEQHRGKMKGGSFKLNMHPKAYFDEKPYTSDKPLPPMKKVPPSKPIPTAFKPSHPAKKVRVSYWVWLKMFKELLFGIQMYVFCFHFLFEAKRKYRCAVRTCPSPKQGCLRCSLLWLQPQGYQTNDRYLFSDDTNTDHVFYFVLLAGRLQGWNLRQLSDTLSGPIWQALQTTRTCG